MLMFHLLLIKEEGFVRELAITFAIYFATKTLIIGYFFFRMIYIKYLGITTFEYILEGREIDAIKNKYRSGKITKHEMTE